MGLPQSDYAFGFFLPHNKEKVMRKMIATLTLVNTVLLTACGGEPEWVGVYEQCKDNVKAQSADIKKSTTGTSDAQSRAMAESMGNMAIGMAMTACEMIRTSCEDDEDSPACRAYVEQARQH
jgi:hypothetical protein